MAHAEPATVDTDSLPPTQYLIIEVLAARYRLGETYWTFPGRLASQARKLEEAGLVWLRSGPAPNAFEARFTDAGRAAALWDGYTSPEERTLARIADAIVGVSDPADVDAEERIAFGAIRAALLHGRSWLDRPGDPNWWREEVP